MESKGMWETLIKRSRQRPNFRKAQQPSLLVKQFTKVADEAACEYAIT